MSFSQASDYIKKHELLLVTLLVLSFAVFGYSHVTDWLDHRASFNAGVAQQALQEQQQANRALTDQLQTEKTEYTALVAKLSAENKALSAHQQTIVVETEKQQKADENLPPDQLATRWDGLVNTSGVAPTTEGYVVSQDAAIKTVQSLEMIPELQTILHDERQKSANDEQQIFGLNKLSASQDELLSGLRAEIQKNDTACKAEVSAVKAVARKSKLRWFGIGVIVGAIARNVIGL